MSNKKLHLVFGLVLAVFVGLIWSFASAVTFTMHFWDAWKPTRTEFIIKNMTPIHFTDNWNDFHWFIYFSNGITTGSDTSETVDNWYEVVSNGVSYECQQRVKWFYYNAERGERLWQLDGDYNGIHLSGWLYTRCRKEWYIDALKNCAWSGNESQIEACRNQAANDFIDSHGYYGMIEHNDWLQKYYLAAWTDYKIIDGWMVMWDNLEPTFIRLFNQYPVWFIYDANWWAWFVWCDIRTPDTYDVKNILRKFNEVTEVGGSLVQKDWGWLFKPNGDKYDTDYLQVDCDRMWSAKNSLISVIVDGLVWINKDSSNLGIEWNQSNDKMQYFSSVDVNNMQLINYARQRAEILCRGKWTDNAINLSNSINCISGGDWVIEAPINKTLVVKGRNVKVKPMGSFENSWYYDIFIDKWNLLIDDAAINDSNLKVFKTNWFIAEGKSLSTFKEEVYDNAWRLDKPYSWEDVAAWKFIKWNFIVNWNIQPSDSENRLDNIYFIYWKMTSKDTVDDLRKVFEWKCNNWTGSDNTPCPWWWSGWNNPYENASLVIIDQNYLSPLYE